MGFLLCSIICLKKEKKHLQNMENRAVGQRIESHETTVSME
jgi:hypothetical protein